VLLDEAHSFLRDRRWLEKPWEINLVNEVFVHKKWLGSFPFTVGKVAWLFRMVLPPSINKKTGDKDVFVFDRTPAGTPLSGDATSGLVAYRSVFRPHAVFCMNLTIPSVTRSQAPPSFGRSCPIPSTIIHSALGMPAAMVLPASGTTSGSSEP
jgi:hypothetical protein